MGVRMFPSGRKKDTDAVDTAALRQKNNRLEEKLRSLETEHCALWVMVLRSGAAQAEDVPEKYRERVHRMRGERHE